MQYLTMTASAELTQVPSQLPVYKGNPCLPHSWQDIPLTYTLHALQRCDERKLPRLETLPSNARLADTDTLPDGTATVTFKIFHEENNAFFIVLSKEGCVITCYVHDAGYKRAHYLKQRRRRLNLLYQA